MACGADSVRAVFLVLMCLVVSSLGPVTASHIEFVALVHRHGDRSPVSFLPTSLNNGYWKEGPGQLTAIGVSMLHKLGVSLRERYVTNTSLFPGFYSRRHVYVRSTDVDRTLMSAESLLEGLFPAGTGPDNANGEPALPNDLQPVPIHTVRPDEDPLLRGCVKRVLSREAPQYLMVLACDVGVTVLCDGGVPACAYCLCLAFTGTPTKSALNSTSCSRNSSNPALGWRWRRLTPAS